MNASSRPWIAALWACLSMTGCLGQETLGGWGAACQDDKACQGDLVCQYGRCRALCTFDRDCPPGSVCIAGAGESDVRVCTLPTESSCGGAHCPEGLVCGFDGYCREGCAANTDCASGRACVSGVCVEGSQDAGIDGAREDGGVAWPPDASSAPDVLTVPDAGVVLDGSVGEDASNDGGAADGAALGDAASDGQATDASLLDASLLDAATVSLPTGELDPGFGDGGVFIHDVPGTLDGEDFGYAVAIDAAGRIVVAGQTSAQDRRHQAVLVVWRLLPEGALDPSFGEGSGWVQFPDVLGPDGSSRGRAVRLDEDGRILVAGSGLGLEGSTDVVVLRLDAAGHLDPTFGNQGIFSHNAAAGWNGNDQAWGLAIDANDSIVLAGFSTSASTGTDMAVWRLTVGGVLDSSFGTGGVGYVTLNGMDTGARDDWANDLVLDELGRVVVVGASDTDLFSRQALWRFDADGVPDPGMAEGYDSFVHPSVWPSSSDGASGQSVVIDGAGRIVVAGSALETVSRTLDAVVWGFSETAEPDPLFGAPGGRQVVLGAPNPAEENEEAMDLTLDSAGNLLVVGRAGARLILWRLTPEGGVDETWGPGGGYVALPADPGTEGSMVGNAMALDQDGSLVVVGSRFNGVNHDLAVWRFAAGP